MRNEKSDSTRDLGRMTLDSREKSGARQCPRILATKANALAIAGCVPPLPSGFFLDWRLFFSALGVDQGQVIFRVKRVTANGLLSGSAQGDVHASIIGQDQQRQIV